MRTLIGALLALTALSPLPAAAQVDRDAGIRPRAEDRGGALPRPDRAGTRDNREEYRAGRPDRSDRDWRPDRRIDDAARQDRGPRGDTPSAEQPRPDRPGPDRPNSDRRPDQPWTGQERGRDRPGITRPDRPRWNGSYAARPYDAPHIDAPPPIDRTRNAVPRGYRARNDWTRSRLDRRDDRWAQSGFDDRRAWNHYRDDGQGRYGLPRYYAPGGWGGYRRFGVGTGLNPVFWARNYWITDPDAYRLPDAYGPYRWVRYYGDALLVDLRSGRVVDAVYDIF